MARTALVALTERTVWPRGRRKTRVVNQASGQAIGAGMGSRARRNVWRVSRYGSAGVDAAITAATSSSSAAATSAPAPPIEWPSTPIVVTSGWRRSSATAARVSAAYSPTDIGSASGPLAPLPRTSKVRTWKPASCRTCAWGIVRSRADSQPWTSTTPGRCAGPAGRYQPGSRRPSDDGISISS